MQVLGKAVFPFILFLVLIAVLLGGPPLGAAPVPDVCPSGCTYDSIQAAISNAKNGTIIWVGNGTYNENIDFLGKAITVRSVSGPESTIIDGGESGSVVIFNNGEGSNSILEGFTITNGAADEGAGIYIYNSSPTITDCIVSGNSARFDGGGIYNEKALFPKITNCIISGNSANFGGGIYNDASSPTITGCTIRDNWTNISFGSGNGGGIYNRRGSFPTISNCNIINNSASNHGGGIYNYQYSTPTITNCTITGNSAGLEGGGIHIDLSSANITDCIISDNAADYGGGIHNKSSSPTITYSTISGNSASIQGGGISNYDSSPTISNCTIKNNVATHFGGGITNTNSSSPTITDCTISGNAADAGGGLYTNASSSKITNCTISGNWSRNEGGGIYNSFNSSPDITNCTITGNWTGFYGGGIYNHMDSSAHIVNSIFWGNEPDEVSLYIFLDPYAVSIEYTNVQGGWIGIGNIDENPLFVNSRPASDAPIAEGDYHLSADSPAIDSGTSDVSAYPTIPSEDIDGNARPQGLGYDMGSDEFFLYQACVFRGGAWLFYDFISGALTDGVWTGSLPGCIPAPIDLDGDGQWEFSQFCDGSWLFYNDDGSFLKGIWTGGSGDLPVPADYDGDGTEDVVVFRNGAWLAFNFNTGQLSWSVWTGAPPHWTGDTPVPVPMDYDGDGAADFTVFSGGPWHFYSADGSYNKGIWTGGVPGDVPVATDYDGDGQDDVVVYRSGAWLASNFATGAPSWGVWTGEPPHWTGGKPLPAPLDYDGDGMVDFTVYSGGPWHFYNSSGTYSKGIWTGGVVGDQPISRRLLP